MDRSAVVDGLAEALFGSDEARIHQPWRDLIATKEFRYQPELSVPERRELAYQRLRAVQEVAGDPWALAGDVHRLTAMQEWVSVVDGILANVAGTHYNLFLGSVLNLGGERRPDTADVAALRRVGTFLCTELDHGNDASALETTATFDRATGEFVLTTPTAGARKFMPNTSAAGGMKSAVVVARLIVDGRDEGVFLFMTPLADEAGPLPGILIEPVPERAGSPVDHCLTSFDQLRLPRQAMLDSDYGRVDADGAFTSVVSSRRRRFLHSIGRVTPGKLCMTACTLGAARAAVALAVHYSRHRHISGPGGCRVPVGAHRSHHSRLLYQVAIAYAMTFLHREVLRAWDRHEPGEREQVERLAAVAKGWITWQARAVITESRERCGARGLLLTNLIGGYLADVEGPITAEGDNLAVWVKAASEMVFGHTCAVRDPRSESGAAGQLTEPAFLRSLLADLERLWQARARTALRQGPPGDPLGRWNNASGPALELVAAHARLLSADAFLQAADRTRESQARRLLQQLCRLFLLQQLRPHTGDLLAEGRLTADHVRSLPGAVEELIASLAPQLATLTDAFRLPEELLAAIPLTQPGTYGVLLPAQAGAGRP